MPRDLIREAELETIPGLSQPTPENLIWVLENWDLSPVRGLKWDYSIVEPQPECGTAGCAVGVARTIWGKDRANAAIPAHGFFDIIMNGQFDKRVTAQVVAGRIRDSLAGRPIRYLVAGDRG